MQSARHLVGALVEFPPRVQHRHYNLQGVFALLLVVAHGDAAAVIANGERLISVYRYLHRIAESRQRLVYGVIDHLVHEVVKAFRPRIAYVHCRPLAHRFQSL